MWRYATCKMPKRHSPSSEKCRKQIQAIDHWRAVCGESCKHGSGGAHGKGPEGTSPGAYPTGGCVGVVGPTRATFWAIQRTTRFALGPGKRAGDHLMGDEFVAKGPVRLQVFVHGTRPVARVDIIKDFRYVYSTEPKAQQVGFQWTDDERDRPPGLSWYLSFSARKGTTFTASGAHPSWEHSCRPKRPSPLC